MVFPRLWTLQVLSGRLGTNEKQNCQVTDKGRGPQIASIVYLRLQPRSAAPGGNIPPGINGRPASGSHPHQSNGEVHYLLRIQVGLCDCRCSISQENPPVKTIYLYIL